MAKIDLSEAIQRTKSGANGPDALRILDALEGAERTADALSAALDEALGELVKAKAQLAAAKKPKKAKPKVDDV